MSQAVNKKVYRNLLQTYGRSPLFWLGTAAETIRVLVIRVYVVIVMAQVTANVASGNIAAAKQHLLYYLIFYTVGAVIGTCGELMLHESENKTYSRQMIAFHDKLIHKDMAFYRDNQTGYLATVLRQYVDSGMLLVRLMHGEMLGSAISLTIPVIVLLVVAPKIGLIAFAIVLVQLTYITWASAKTNKYRDESHEVYRKITGEVADEITNIVAFKSGGVEEAASSKLVKLSKQEVDIFWVRRKIASLLDLPRSMVTVLGISLAVLIIINGASTATDPKTLGVIVLTLTYMFQIVRNVVALPELVSSHDELVTKIYPTLEYLGEDYEKIRDPAKPVKLNISKGAISIKDVQFSYPTQSKKAIAVFDGLTIEIAGNERVGVVGLSGAGKSTLANLLLRFDEVTGGSIKVDGIDIRDVKQSDLHQNIAYVPQEPLLFHRSVKENIAYYNDSASQDDIVKAAKAAHAHDFIVKLPDGYNTTVGERGVKLSGGQKQRVAIARVILKHTPILIFDEATSALDSESEQIIQNALPEIIGKQTAIIIAHRLSTVAGLDRIIVMHDGRIVEEGTHHALLKLRGRYYSLWQKQTTDHK